MGCGFITQKELINANEVDLNCNITKQLYIENIDKTIKNDHTNNLNKTRNDVFLSEKTTSKNVLEFKEDIIHNNNQQRKTKPKKKKEPIIYGPIITMLKRQYNNNINKQ